MRKYTNSSLEKALALIERLSAERRPLSLAEVARMEGLHRSTAFGHLAVLQSHGYVRKDPQDGRYTLGHRIFRVGNRMNQFIALAHMARSAIQRAAASTGEQVYFAALDGPQAMLADVAEITSQRGQDWTELRRVPAHAHGAGQVLLAYRERPVVQSLFRDMTISAPTSRSPRSLRAILDLCEHIQNDGYRLERGEWQEGAATLAVPVFADPGFSRHVIAVTAPSNRLDEARAARLVGSLRRLSEEISVQMRDPEEASQTAAE